MAKIDKPKPTSSAVMSFPQPPLRNSQEYLKAYTGYAYTAISSIAEEVASIKLKLFRMKFVKGKPEPEPVLEHIALSTLNYVNPLKTLYDQIEATQTYLELTGEAFWVVLRQGNTPKELWLLRPDWVKIVPDEKEIIKHYIYNPGGLVNDRVIIPRESMIHFKYFHPLNPYRGKGSIQAAALPLDIHTFAQEYNRNFFFNSAIPSLVFTTDKRLSETAIKRFINQWLASYGGRAKSNKIAFLGGGLKMDKVSQGSKELDFPVQQKMMRDDILAVFKVPKTILGMTDDVNRANAFSTTRSFMERVITPRMRKFTEQLNEFYLPMFGDSTLFFDFVDPAPEDVELKLKRYASGLGASGGKQWLTVNEVRVEENLEPLEGGDELEKDNTEGTGGEDDNTNEPPESNEGEDEKKGFLNRVFSRKEIKIIKMREKKKLRTHKKKEKFMVSLPTKKVTVLKREKLEKDLTKDLTKLIGNLLTTNKTGTIKEEPKVEDSPKEIEEKKDELFTEEAKDAYWRAFIETVTEREHEMKEKAIELFKQQEKDILETLDQDVKYWRKGIRKGKESSVLPSLEFMNRLWESVFVSYIREIVIEQGEAVLQFLGVRGNLDLTTDPATNYLRVHGAKLVSDINETTRNKLKKTLAEGFDKGESVTKLSKRVRDVFKDATRNRSVMIARTESLRASNFATVEAYRQSEVVEAKQWLTERDLRTCPWCQEMDGRLIDVTETYFKSGDTLSVKNDEGKTVTLKVGSLDIGYPPLHPNCRCTTIPILLGEKAIIGHNSKVDEQKIREEGIKKIEAKRLKNEKKQEGK